MWPAFKTKSACRRRDHRHGNIYRAQATTDRTDLIVSGAAWPSDLTDRLACRLAVAILRSSERL